MVSYVVPNGCLKLGVTVRWYACSCVCFQVSRLRACVLGFAVSVRAPFAVGLRVEARAVWRSGVG